MRLSPSFACRHQVQPLVEPQLSLRVPACPWLAPPFAARSSAPLTPASGHPSVPEHGGVGLSTCCRRTMRGQRGHCVAARRNRPERPLRLRRLEPALEDGLTHTPRSRPEIQRGPPAERQQFPCRQFSYRDQAGHCSMRFTDLTSAPERLSPTRRRGVPDLGLALNGRRRWCTDNIRGRAAALRRRMANAHSGQRLLPRRFE